MGKYEPLAKRLRDQPQDSWVATFAEIEKVLGFPLPSSARRYHAWWGNQRSGGHSQAKGWQDAGWRVSQVDLDNERASFERASLAGSPGSMFASEDSEQTLFARASAYLGTDDREKVLREALKALCEREAGRRLARLGGTMPDIKVPPRRRFAW